MYQDVEQNVVMLLIVDFILFDQSVREGLVQLPLLFWMQE
jgi:hypothetical protein